MLTYLVTTFFFTIFFSAFCVKAIIKISYLKKLYDQPAEDRKIHIKATPNIGGVALFFSFLFSLSILSKYIINKNSILYLYSSLIIVFLFSLKDDLVGLSSNKRFVSQIISGFILIWFGNYRIMNLNGFMGLNEINEISSILISIFFFVFITNAYNLIDGINGLAGSIALLSSIIFSIIYFYNSDFDSLILSIIFIGSLIGFLYFNLGNAKIFMGSTGSYLIGVLMYIFSINFLNNNYETIQNDSKIAIVNSILFIPFYDTIRVFILRVINKKSPFVADSNHIHHVLLRFKISHTQVVIILLTINLFLIFLSFNNQNLGSLTLVFLDLIIFLLFNLIVIFIQNKFPKK